MNQQPNENGDDQADQENRKLFAKLTNSSLSCIPDKVNEFGFQVILIVIP
jgi:hypothetical protein